MEVNQQFKSKKEKKKSQLPSTDRWIPLTAASLKRLMSSQSRFTGPVEANTKRLPGRPGTLMTTTSSPRPLSTQNHHKAQWAVEGSSSTMTAGRHCHTEVQRAGNFRSFNAAAHIHHTSLTSYCHSNITDCVMLFHTNVAGMTTRYNDEYLLKLC